MSIVPLLHQVTHIESLVDTIDKYNFALDCSPTGTGKMYTACFVAEQNKPIMVYVVCPPLLIDLWKRVIGSFSVTSVVFSYHSILYTNPIRHKNGSLTSDFKQVLNESSNKHPVLFILDESQIIKNLDTKMTSAFYRVFSHHNVKNSTIKTLVSSATPVDKEEQIRTISALFSIPNFEMLKDRTIRSSFMDKSIPTITEFILKSELTEEEIKFLIKSQDAVKNIGFISEELRDGQLPHIQLQKLKEMLLAFCNKYIHATHNLLLRRVISMVNSRLQKPGKAVLVLHFKDHIQHAAQELQIWNPLILSGDTPTSQRMGIIDQFQKESDEHRLIIISLTVGNLGISLDDQHGGCPRTMYILPTLSAISLLQVIGRVKRACSKTTPKVYIVTETQMSRYGIENLQKKMKIIKQVTENQLIWKTEYQHTRECRRIADKICEKLPHYVAVEWRNEYCCCQ